MSKDLHFPTGYAIILLKPWRCGAGESKVQNIALGAVFPDREYRRLRKEGDKEVEILSVLRELLGEAIHIVILNASSLGALLVLFRDWIHSKHK